MITEADIRRAYKIGEMVGELVRLGVPDEALKPIRDYVHDWAGAMDTPPQPRGADTEEV